MKAVHLADRFLRSLWPFGPRAAQEAWVKSVLSPAEQSLWTRMSAPDRRHAVAVARRVERALGTEATPAVLAAALLHDVGKVAASLGTYGRVVATIAAMFARRDTAALWSTKGGFTRKVGLYLRHDSLGADLLALAGSDPLTVDWARQHHRPPSEWTLEPQLAAALKAADDD